MCLITPFGSHLTDVVLIASVNNNAILNHVWRFKLKTRTSEENTTRVWDLWVRVFHWSLVLFVLILFITEGDFLSIHSYAGYTVLLLVGFRIIWGFIGSYYARFSSFITTPKEAIKYLKEELAGDAKRYIGHNPAGAIMIFALLITLIFTGFTGMATVATEGKGPLANTFIASFSGEVMGEIHEIFTSILLTLIILHIVGVIFSSLAEEENLVRAMFTGKKKKEMNYAEIKNNEG